MEGSQILLIVLVVVMVLILVVVPMFTNKKRQKSINDLHSSIQVGDIVMTVGGVKGKVVDIREISPVEKNIIVETGIDENKCTIAFDITAIYQVLSKANAPATLTEQTNVDPFNAEKTNVEGDLVAEEPKADVVAEEPVKEEVKAEVKTEEVSESEALTDSAATTKPAAKKTTAKSKK